jgi:hypothetical protein
MSSIKEFELYFLDLSKPTNKSRIIYRGMEYISNEKNYSLDNFHDINSLNIGDSLNLSFSNIEHWIRRVN